MKVEGKIFKANIVMAFAVAEQNDPANPFVKNLENCLIQLCREMEIPIPLWLKKNTHEFAIFHQTIFSEEQFMEKVTFDRFQIKLLK